MSGLVVVVVVVGLASESFFMSELELEEFDTTSSEFVFVAITIA